MAKVVPWAEIKPGHTYWMDMLDAPSVIMCECLLISSTDEGVRKMFTFTDLLSAPFSATFKECEGIRYWDSEPTRMERMKTRWSK